MYTPITKVFQTESWHKANYMAGRDNFNKLMIPLIFLTTDSQ